MPEHQHHVPVMSKLDVEEPQGEFPEHLHITSSDQIDYDQVINAFIAAGESERYPNKPNGTSSSKFSYTSLKRSLCISIKSTNL